MKNLLILPFVVFIAFCSFGQTPGMKTLSLKDLSAFKPNAGNWQLAGSVSMDPNVDSHPGKEAVPKGKKSRKKKVEGSPAVSYTSGVGILVNKNTEEKKDNLVTSWEHGDIELELEVMMPKNANSGIYLQGGYEVQLFDSWGKKDAEYSDIGGIYRNWETEPSLIYMGKAPRINAAKAPGLWQKFRISFQAPRFNAAGEKTANAKFLYIDLNGVRIHENVEVPQLTGGAIDSKEKPMGPLMIQGDHGSVAIRNIRYRLLKESGISLSPITYKVFHGSFTSLDSFGLLKPTRSGTIPQLEWSVAGLEDGFAVVYTAQLTVAEDNEYKFMLFYNGDASLSIDNKQVLVKDDDKGEANLFLNKGVHNLELVYNKNANWMDPKLGLSISSVNSAPQTFQSLGSMPPGEDLDPPIIVKPGSEPRLLRAFLDFNGQREKRLTHTIAIGEPGGIHYIYDLKAGNLVCVWKGGFVDATPMWHERGDGSFRPLGMLRYLFSSPSLAVLSNPTDTFPTVNKEEDFRGNGYMLVAGRPQFNYTYKNVEVTDKIVPDAENKMFIREVSFKNFSQSSAWFKLGEGSDIVSMPDGSFAVDDYQYYIRVLSGTQPIIREQPGGIKELVLKVEGNPIKYSIIW